MEIFLQLAKIGIIPVVASALLYKLYRTKFLSGDALKIPKQIFAGLIFGGIAILGTEYGVLYNGAVINARDAAPICAALIFGGPAGIIAGFIGGIERWFAVYWGAGAYTRIACAVSTCLAGLFAAMIRRYMFEDKTPNWFYSLIIGIIIEIFHMNMVFMTNVSDPITAFGVVKACTAPIVIVNSLSAGLAVFIINLMDKSDINVFDNKLISITQQFQKRLAILVLIAFIITSAFSTALQQGISTMSTQDLLRINIEDTINDIKETSDNAMLKVSKNVAEIIKNKDVVTDTFLDELCETYNLPELSYINPLGFIVNSSNRQFVGYDMKSGEQSNVFMCLARGEAEEFVQDYQPINYDSSISRKYAGVALEKGNFIQVGYDAERFQEDIYSEVIVAAHNRHIGETGGLFIIDNKGFIVSDSEVDREGEKFKSLTSLSKQDYEEGTLYQATIFDEKVYFMYSTAEGYDVFAYITTQEQNFNKELSIYLNGFMEVLVFAALFVIIFFLIERLIVKNIKKINSSLGEITNGNLDTPVEARSNIEFNDLSNGINTTVDAMKKLIADANARIDSELEYAKSIQHSSLPSIFPPFPDRNEFEIYATMDAAKEVGGDFYDFYFVDDNKLAFLIADVSGKSIPGALFMMRAKSTIKQYADGGLAVEDILTNANFSLCEGNDAGMFVTCWIGFLDLTTGLLKFSNAGHNPPMLRKNGGTYEYLKCRPGFVLAGMEGIAYKVQEVQLEPGDEIYLYTDGVPEATNMDKVLFGDDRLYASINSHKDESCENICKLIKKDVDEFVGEAEQFDDITMLSLKFIKCKD